jgi:hypothetical protein
MSRNTWTQFTVFSVVLLGAAYGTYAQQGRAGGGRGAEENEVRPPMMFRETWKQPPYTGKLNDENRRATQDAVGNPNLELKLYGADAKDLGVYVHEGRQDVWNGMCTSPMAATLRDKNSYMDLTGLARLRWMVRTNGLHVIHPVVKLADGTLLAGSHVDNTNGDYIQTEVSFNNQRWYILDPVKVTTGKEMKNPDLSKVDEIGVVDLAPGGGHGNAGWFNVSGVELYAKAVPRGSASASR